MKKQSDDFFIQQMMQETFEEVSYEGDLEPIDFDSYFDQKVNGQGFEASHMVTLMSQLGIESQEMQSALAGFYRVTVKGEVLDIPENFVNSREGEFKLLTPEDDKDCFLSVLSYLDTNLCAVVAYQSRGKSYICMMNEQQFNNFYQQPMFQSKKAAA